MKVALLNENDGQRTFAVVLSMNEEAFSCLSDFAKQHKIGAAQVSAIGAFKQAKLQFFDWASKTYLDLPVGEQVEVASLLGDIALSPEGEPVIHLHAVLGKRDGSTVSGHFAEGFVRPTLEAIVTETPGHLKKKFDPVSGLAL